MPKEDAIQGLKETYSQQLKLYSQALETIKQKKVDEAYLYIFSTGDIIDMWFESGFVINVVVGEINFHQSESL